MCVWTMYQNMFIDNDDEFFFKEIRMWKKLDRWELFFPFFFIYMVLDDSPLNPIIIGRICFIRILLLDFFFLWIFSDFGYLFSCRIIIIIIISQRLISLFLVGSSSIFFCHPYAMVMVNHSNNSLIIHHELHQQNRKKN